MATGGLDIDDLRPVMGGSNLFEPDDVAADDSECETDGMDMNVETKVVGVWTIRTLNYSYPGLFGHG